MKGWLALAATALFGSTAAFAQTPDRGDSGQCNIPSTTIAQIQAQVRPVTRENNGGIFNPGRVWSAIVDREGHLCSVVEVGDAWPGSRAIAIAKAFTANGFSNSADAYSTTNLYSAVQPGGSLYGLNNSNPYNPEFLPGGSGEGQVPGGIITFGGGLALYSGARVIGALGISGDTSCADHAIAWRIRQAAGFPVPPGFGLNGTDNIIYLAPGEAPNGSKQPHCTANDITP